MSKICVEAEKTINYKRLYADLRKYSPEISTAECLAASTVRLVNDLSLSLVIVLTDSGKLARLVAKYRPSVPILAVSVNNSVVKQLNVTRGVICYKIPSFVGTDNVLLTTV